MLPPEMLPPQAVHSYMPPATGGGKDKESEKASRGCTAICPFADRLVDALGNKVRCVVRRGGKQYDSAANARHAESQHQADIMKRSKWTSNDQVEKWANRIETHRTMTGALALSALCIHNA